jgi:hypothetical protein
LIHQGDANQNSIELSSHPSQNGYHQENKQNTNGDEDAEKKPLYTVGGGCKFVLPLWKLVWRVLET